MSLLVKRLFIWAVSFALGLLLTYLIVVVVFPIWIPAEAGKDLRDYGFGHTILTVIPIALLFVTWLDYLLDARILPD